MLKKRKKKTKEKTNKQKHPDVREMMNIFTDKADTRYIAWEKAMAPHSSIIARKIPWMEKAGRLQSMGSHRVEHD